jgi:hypothetical protein
MLRRRFFVARPGLSGRRILRYSFKKTPASEERVVHPNKVGDAGYNF